MEVISVRPLAPILPMFQRFRARLFAEVHLTVDQHESCGAALRVLGVARLVERVRRPPAADLPPAVAVKTG